MPATGRLRPGFAFGRIVLAAMVAIVGACRSETPLTSPEESAVFAKGPGASGAVEVTAASPSEAPTDTIVQVVVTGKNFTKGAKAKWSIAGDTTRVHVLSTTYVNASQLKAQVQVPADAPLGSYDIEVYLVDGKKGVGAELFLVKKNLAQTPQSATFTFPAAGFNLTSSGGTDYVDGVCAVMARVFYLEPNYLDGNLQLDNPRSKDRSCTTTPRKLTITYPDNGLVQSNTGGMNIGNMGTVTQASGPQERPMNIGIAGNGTRCVRLGFGNLIGGTKVMVTRVSSTQWNVASKPGGTAMCERANGTTELISNFAVNFNVTLR